MFFVIFKHQSKLDVIFGNSVEHPLSSKKLKSEATALKGRAQECIWKQIRGLKDLADKNRKFQAWARKIDSSARAHFTNAETALRNKDAEEVSASENALKTVNEFFFRYTLILNSLIFRLFL